MKRNKNFLMDSDLNISNIFSKIPRLFFKSNKTIVVLLGTFGVTISVFNNKKLIDYIFVDKKGSGEFKNFHNILSRYKGYKILFLLDGLDTKIYHEALPVVQNIIRSSPVNDFLNDEISNKYTVAYNVLEKSKKDIETWFTIFSLIPLDQSLENWICHSMDYGIHFGGVYHLQLEIFDIINSILVKTNNKPSQNLLQICFVVTQAFGIFLFIKNDNHIIYTKRVEYLEGYSNEYLEGLIENEASNILIDFKSYIKNNNMNIGLVLIAPDSFLNNLQKIEIPLDSLINLPFSRLYSEFSQCAGYQFNFADNLISSLFASKQNYPAVNKEISSIKKLTEIYKIIFTPIKIFIAILLFKISLSSYNIIVDNSEIINLNKQTLQLINEYNRLKSQYKDQKNFNKILDYYALNNIISSQKIETPHKIFETIINNPNSKNATILNIEWNLSKQSYIQNNGQNCIIEMKYNMSDTSPSKFFNSLECYIKHLKDNLKNYNIEYKINKQKLLKISNLSSIYVTIKLNNLNN